MKQNQQPTANSARRVSMGVTGNAGLLRAVNRNLVLNTIWRLETTSRAAVSRETGLNRATVSTLVDELLRIGLIRENGPVKSAVGRRPVELVFNAMHRIAIGVDIGVNYLRAASVDLQGNILDATSIATSPKPTEAALLEGIAGLVDELVQKSGNDKSKFLGVGIAVPGICDRQDGIVKWSNSFGWKDLPLSDLVSKRTGLGTVIENMAYLGAYGEMWRGACSASENVVYVSAGYSLGAGVLIRGQLYLGSQGFAGRVGHLTIAWDGPKCACGNHGCWELYASEAATLTRAHEIVKSKRGADLRTFLGDGEISLSMLIEASEAGVRTAQEILAETGKFLGVGIAGLITAFNPDLVVIGNSIAECGDWILEPMRREISLRQVPGSFAQVDIRTGDLGADATVLGAACLLVTENYQLSVRPPSNALDRIVAPAKSLGLADDISRRVRHP